MTETHVLIGGIGDGMVVEIPYQLRVYRHAVFPDPGKFPIGTYLEGIKTENYTLRRLRCDGEIIEFWAEESMRDIGAINHLICSHAKTT